MGNFKIVKLVDPIIVQTNGVNASIGGNTTGTLALISSGTMFLSGGNNITLSQNGNTVEIQGGAGGGGGADGLNRIVAGTQTAGTLATVVFSNSNNVTFGMSNSSIVTASASFNQSVQTQNMVSVLGSTGNISFGNANGITFGGNGSTVTASHNGLTSQSNQAFSAGGGSSAFQTLSFADGSGVSFTNTNGSIGATVKTDYALSDHSHGNPTLALTNLSGTTASNSNGLTLSLSANVGGGAGDGYNIIGVNGAGTNSATTIQFSNSNNVTFGLNAGTITASASYSQSTQPVAVSGQNGSYAFSTLSFSNANGISFGTSAGSALTASHNGITSQSIQTQGMVSINGSTGAISLATGSSLSSSSNGSTITFGLASNITTALQSANANYLTSQSNQAFSASGGSSAFQTLNFANSNGLTFSNSNGSVIASYTVPTQSAQTANFYVSSNSTQLSSTAGVDLRSVSFMGAGIASVGVSEGKVLVSVPAGGGGGDGYNEAGFTNSTANSTMSLVWAGNSNGSGNITMGLTGSTVTASAPSGGGGKTGSYFDNMLQQNSVQALTFTSVSTQLFGRVILQPLTPGNEFFPFSMTASTMLMNFSNSGSSNISGAFSSSWYIGVYTRNNSTQLSLLNSVSTSYGLAANANNSASFLGARYLSFHSSQWSSQPVFTEGRYFFALLARSSSNSYASHSLAGMHIGASIQRSGQMAAAAASNTSSNAWHPFMGVHSLTTHTALPASIANSEINKASSYANFVPQVIFDAGLGVMG